LETLRSLASTPANHLFNDLKSELLSVVQRQSRLVVTVIESCISATIDWIGESATTPAPPRDRKSRPRRTSGPLLTAKVAELVAIFGISISAEKLSDILFVPKNYGQKLK
jgi:hypothetical protein